jgi:hypothetical protein
MLIASLIVLNIPVYLFIGWLAFDNKSNAADTFFDTIVDILKQVFIPNILRELMGMDTSGSWGIVPIAGFFFACGGIVYGEFYLISKYFLG